MRRNEPVLPEYDFSDALALPAQEQLETCVATLSQRFRDWRPLYEDQVPPIPDTLAQEEDLQQIEQDNGVPLPQEYRAFLRVCRYLDLGDGLGIGDGLKVWGVANQNEDGVSDCEIPWVSQEHAAGARFWVIGDYWRYADGDQLLIPVQDTSQPVMLYLHEHGPLIEQFAPSFSLALWRLLDETL